MPNDLREAWPPAVPEDSRGYRPPELGAAQPVAACDLGDGRYAVVLRWASGSTTALPCFNHEGTWRVAGAGDGAALALLARLETPEWPLPAGFELRRYDGTRFGRADELDLGTDQSNMSVVVGDQAIVKWRSAPDADGRRATRLRRHLRATGFASTPPLRASLEWTDAEGRSWFLTDVDAFLPDAEDGWDHGIETVRSTIESDIVDTAYAESLGHLTAELHAAMSAPSEIIPQPKRAATPGEMAAVRAAGLELLRRTLAIEAEEQDHVVARASMLQASIEGAPTDTTPLAPIHGDLHIGQLVPWRDGIDIIDFDGAPEPTAPPGELESPARDVAQMVCSLWSLAAVVDRRTEGAHPGRLRAWGRASEAAFLSAYRLTLGEAAGDVFDDRMLEPFVSEQLCRELLYADDTLPRWRYAPLQALRWRYALEPDDDD